MPMPIDNDCLLLRQIDTRRLQLLPSPIFRRSSSDSLINDLEVVEEQTRTIHFKSEPDVTFRGGGRVGSSVSTASFGDRVEGNRLGTETGTGAGAGSGSGTNMPFDDDDDEDLPPLVEAPPASDADFTDYNTEYAATDYEHPLTYPQQHQRYFFPSNSYSHIHTNHQTPYSLGQSYAFPVPGPTAGSLRQGQSGPGLEPGPMTYTPVAYPPYLTSMSPYTPNLPFAPDLGLRDSYAFSVALPTSTESGNQIIGKTDGSEEAKEEHAGEESRAGPGSSYVGDHGGVRGDASASGASSETATVRNVKINHRERSSSAAISVSTEPATRPMVFPSFANVPLVTFHESMNNGSAQTQMEVDALHTANSTTNIGNSGNNAYFGHGYGGPSEFYAFGNQQIYHSHQYPTHVYSRQQVQTHSQLGQAQGGGQAYGQGYSQAQSPSIADAGSNSTPSRSPLLDAQQQNQGDTQTPCEQSVQTQAYDESVNRQSEHFILPEQSTSEEQKGEIGANRNINNGSSDGSNSGKTSSNAISSPHLDLDTCREPASGPERHVRSSLVVDRKPVSGEEARASARKGIQKNFYNSQPSPLAPPSISEPLPITFPPSHPKFVTGPPSAQQIRMTNNTSLTVNTNPNRPPSYIPRPPNAFILFRASFVRAQSLGGEALTEFARTIGIHGVVPSSSKDKEKIKMAGSTGGGKGVSALGRESVVTITPSHDPGGKSGKSKSKGGSRRASPTPGSPIREGSGVAVGGDITSLVMAYIEKAQQTGSAISGGAGSRDDSVGRGRGKGRVKAGVGGKANKDSKSPPPGPSIEGDVSTPDHDPDIRIQAGGSKDHLASPARSPPMAQASVASGSNVGTPSSSTTLSKLAGQLWRALAPAERKVWEKRAKIAQAEHRRKYPDWRFRPENLNSGTGPGMHRFSVGGIGVGDGGGEVNSSTGLNLGLGMGVGNISTFGGGGDNPLAGANASVSKRAGKEKEKEGVIPSTTVFSQHQESERQSLSMVNISENSKDDPQRRYRRETEMGDSRDIKIEHGTPIESIEKGGESFREEENTTRNDEIKKLKIKGSGRPRGRPKKNKGKAKAETEPLRMQEGQDISESGTKNGMTRSIALSSSSERAHERARAVCGQDEEAGAYDSQERKRASEDVNRQTTIDVLPRGAEGTNIGYIMENRPFSAPPVSDSPVRGTLENDQSAVKGQVEFNNIVLINSFKGEDSENSSISTPILSRTTSHKPSLETIAPTLGSSTSASPFLTSPKLITSLSDLDPLPQRHKRVFPSLHSIEPTSPIELEQSFFDGGPLHRRHVRTGTNPGTTSATPRREGKDNLDSKESKEGREGLGPVRNVARRNTVSAVDAAAAARRRGMGLNTAEVLASLERHGSPPPLSPSPTSPSSPPFSPYTPYSPYSTPFSSFSNHHHPHHLHRHSRAGHVRHSSLVSVSHPSPLSLTHAALASGSIPFGHGLENPMGAGIRGRNINHQTVRQQDIYGVDNPGRPAPIYSSGPPSPSSPSGVAMGTPHVLGGLQAIRADDMTLGTGNTLNPNPVDSRGNVVNISSYSSLTGWAGTGSMQTQSPSGHSNAHQPGGSKR